MTIVSYGTTKFHIDNLSNSGKVLLVEMRNNTPLLEKKAIKFALSESWQAAIEINKEILKADPKNVKAKVRLANAYLKTKSFDKAKKLYQEVLKADPINSVALKNLELAKAHKTTNGVKTANGRSLIKEPGTSKEIKTLITEKGITANHMSYGECMSLEISASKVIAKEDKKKITEITDTSLVKALNTVKRQGGSAKAYFVKGSEKEMVLFIQTSIPVFKGEKQDVTPYMRKGSLEEPDFEVESYDEMAPEDTEE